MYEQTNLEQVRKTLRIYGTNLMAIEANWSRQSWTQPHISSECEAGILRAAQLRQVRMTLTEHHFFDDLESAFF